LPISLIFGQACGLAQGNLAVYTPPVLKAPYTLTFSVQVEKPNIQLRKNTPVTSQQTGTLTLSDNGKKFVYLAKFGKWSDVIICDTTTDTEYSYDNRFVGAFIMPGVNMGLVNMSMLPMPGVGYDFYPMFQSFHYLGSGPSRANMATIGAASAATDNYVQSLAYQDTIVQVNHKSIVPTVSSCKMIVTNMPALVEEIWRFSKYRMLGSVPVAGAIDHVINTPTVQGPWPPQAMMRDGEVRYTLLTASTAALPDRQYDLESYLPRGCAVNDARKSP
jgi:hypothetical protein